MDADQSFVRGYGASSSVTHDQVPSFGQEEDVRKGPWTVEEDSTLMECINTHGEGRWNSLAGRSGLKRSGKSCRLRWLNYLRPNVRRGNITLEEQLLILQLHCRWGNRWSKIAESLPGRTDNEIKNYWRTRVQKQAKQFNCDVNSKQFQDKMNYVWIPRIMERIRASSNPSISDRPTATATATATAFATPSDDYCLSDHSISAAAVSSQLRVDHNFVPEISSSTSEFEVCLDYQYPEFKCSPNYGSDLYCFGPDIRDFEQVETSNSWSTPGGDFGPDIRDFEQVETSNSWSTPGGDLVENLWNEENIWFLQQQLNSDI